MQIKANVVSVLGGILVLSCEYKLDTDSVLGEYHHANKASIASVLGELLISSCEYWPGVASVMGELHTNSIIMSVLGDYDVSKQILRINKASYQS